MQSKAPMVEHQQRFLKFKQLCIIKIHARLPIHTRYLSEKIAQAHAISWKQMFYPYTFIAK